MFKKIDSKMNLPKMEEEILEFWEKEKIFEKSVANRKGAKQYSFYDGPPFATGTPHYGHIVASTIKDAVPRYWTMRGYQVERRWGWDCHGLPIENIAEKELGISHKKEIETLGVAKFNEVCRSKVLEYVSEWKRVMHRFGRWADMENAYRTMDRDFMESVWWVFKELWDKGLIYESYRIMHICPRCETTLSQSEVAEGYKDVKDLSVVAKFELVDEPGTFVLAWTTTPWTLPGNVALAVGEDIEYVKVRQFAEISIDDSPRPEGRPSTAEYFLIVSKTFFEEKLKDDEWCLKMNLDFSFEEISSFKGSELVGKAYKPLFDCYSKDEKLQNRENGWKIYAAEFVNTDDGTGVVHIAPAFGEDDMALGKKENLPFVQHVNRDGTIRSEVGEGLGCLSVKPSENPQSTDVEIIRYLAKNDLFFSKEKYEHSYPHCWRCDTPLLNYATSSWFVKVSAIKEKAIELAKEIQWVPEHIKKGRFGKWLEGARDWSISRQRYWGSAIPLWKSEDGSIEVIGSIEDLYQANREFGDITKVLFVRHGERENAREPITDYEGIFDLSENGQRQAEALVEKCTNVSINAFISSPVSRCIHTIDRLAELRRMKVITDERLKEINNRNQGKPFIDRPKSLHISWNGGESFQEVIRRVTECLSDILDRHRGETILIAAHGDTFHILRREYEKLCSNQFPEPAVLYEMYFFSETKLPVDVHKHLIDSIRIKKDGKIYKRIPDILDTWFDSGSMPYAQSHYPFENKEKFDAGFPAQFIAEGVDQTRAWFYYLHVIATSIKDSNAFHHVIVNGIVLAEDGKKMSKKLKNYPDPMLMFDKYGADVVRLYLLSSPVVSAENLNFSEKEVSELERNVFRMLWNSYSFFVMYANVDKWNPSTTDLPTGQAGSQLSITNLLDRWILSELQLLIKEVNGAMEAYELNRASRAFVPFIDHLSNWYIRRSRKRFWKNENDGDKNSAYQTLYDVLVTLSKLMAPFTPFLAEEIYRNLIGGESVHLKDFPTVDEDLIDEKLNEDMRLLREAVTLGLQFRAERKIKVRQPLSKVLLPQKYSSLLKRVANESTQEWENILCEELNVKRVVFGDYEKVEIDIKVTPELALEGEAREIIRAIQEGRKKASFNVEDRIVLGYSGKEKVFAMFGDMIAKEVLATKHGEGGLKDFEYSEEVNIEGESFRFWLKRV